MHGVLSITKQVLCGRYEQESSMRAPCRLLFLEHLRTELTSPSNTFDQFGAYPCPYKAPMPCLHAQEAPAGTTSCSASPPFWRRLGAFLLLAAVVLLATSMPKCRLPGPAQELMHLVYREQHDGSALCLCDKVITSKTVRYKHLEECSIIQEVCIKTAGGGGAPEEEGGGGGRQTPLAAGGDGAGQSGRHGFVWK